MSPSWTSQPCGAFQVEDHIQHAAAMSRKVLLIISSDQGPILYGVIMAGQRDNLPSFSICVKLESKRRCIFQTNPTSVESHPSFRLCLTMCLRWTFALL